MSNVIRCREIELRDVPDVITLLTNGFRAQRDRAYWVRALRHLAERTLDDDVPQFGYLLEAERRVVGVILLIFARVPQGDTSVLRCNLSSWFVEKGFRALGPLLISRALRHRQASYINLTPAPHTFGILEAQGFQRFCEGRMIVVPTLARPRRDVRVETFHRDMRPGDGLNDAELRLLRAHQAHDCLCIVATEAGRRLPFVFAPRRRGGIVGLAVLAYCRDLDDVVRLAGPLGWHLLRRGFPLLVVDANGPIAGLVGRYSATKPKYARGLAPRLGDAAYTERTMFGS